MCDEMHNSEVSAELDAVACDCIGECLDALAEGVSFGVLVCCEDREGNRSFFNIEEDSEEVSLEEANVLVKRAISRGIAEDGLGKVRRYAISYLGVVADEDGNYVDALLTVFAEKNMQVAYSTYTLVGNIGAGENFVWNEPQPAGEEPILF